jgi:hypothetical protein
MGMLILESCLWGIPLLVGLQLHFKFSMTELVLIGFGLGGLVACIVKQSQKGGKP